jgi:predicted AlkP superfamily pyrophosphatase or phosphodiesterase
MLAQGGVVGPMQVQFPSYTFPNHFTLVTGLLPAYHGIVNNNFYDPILKEFFIYNAGNNSHEKWWNAEPVLGEQNSL